MSRAQYWILNLTSALLAAVVAFEMYSSDQLDAARERERQTQIPLLQAEQIRPVAERMVERVAQGAMSDPALKNLLSKYGLKMTTRALGNGSQPPASPSSPTTDSNP